MRSRRSWLPAPTYALMHLVHYPGQVQNLVNAGYDVTVWNRSPKRCEPLVDAGAKVRQRGHHATCDGQQSFPEHHLAVLI